MTRAVLGFALACVLVQPLPGWCDDEEADEPPHVDNPVVSLLLLPVNLLIRLASVLGPNEREDAESGTNGEE